MRQLYLALLILALLAQACSSMHKEAVTGSRTSDRSTPPSTTTNSSTSSSTTASESPISDKKESVLSSSPEKLSIPEKAATGTYKMVASPAMLYRGTSETYTISEADISYDMADPGDPYSTPSTTVPAGRAGILTAGELHDFSKWNLWTDVAGEQLKAYQATWKMHPLERYSVQATTNNDHPLIDATVDLLDSKGYSLWTARTDNTGKAELWASLFDSTSGAEKNYTLRLSYNGQQKTIEAKPFGQSGINHISLPVACDVPDAVDAMFVVDATGSMGDEISYLQAELENIIGKVKEDNPKLGLRVGSVFYRDYGDAYLTKKSDLSTNPTQTIDFIKQQSAGGGGDYPEAVEAALKVAIEETQWDPNARARLMFLVLDAPPRANTAVFNSLQHSIRLAAEKGIRIIPIGASGIDKSTEYLMRSIALATNGTYVFLTDHSGVGNPHIQPSTDSYDVELLNDLLIRLFNQYSYAPSCSESKSKLSKADTLFVVKSIAKVVLDSNQQNIVTDTTNNNPNHVQYPDSPKQQTELKCYPNPTSGPLTVEVMGDVKEVYLADLSGKLIQRYQVVDKQPLHIDLSQFPSGTYLIECESDNTWLSGKIILAR